MFRVVFDWFELYCGGLVVVVVWLFGMGWVGLWFALVCVVFVGLGLFVGLLVLLIVWVLVVDVCYSYLVCFGVGGWFDFCGLFGVVCCMLV